MSKIKGMTRLAALSQLILDQELQALRAAADRLERSRMQLAAVNAAEKPAELPTVAAGIVDVAYRRWADLRRAELNAVIARQTVDWIDARGDASTAFGRLQALRGAMERKNKRR